MGAPHTRAKKEPFSLTQPRALYQYKLNNLSLLILYNRESARLIRSNPVLANPPAGSAQLHTDVYIHIYTDSFKLYLPSSFYLDLYLELTYIELRNI